MTVDTLPDAEALVIAFLQAHPLIEPLVGTQVGSTIQETWTGLCIRVIRIGGTLIDSYADNPRLQLDCWSSLDDGGGAQAADLALNVAAAVYDLPGQHDGAYVPYVVIADGPIPEADDQQRPRYRLDITFELYNRQENP